MAIVTLSRKSGTGATDIARAVAKKLQYEFVSKDSIYKEIEVHGKEWLDWVARLDEHAPTVWERYDQSHAAYLALVEHCIYKNALKNNVVILGRGGNYLLENDPLLPAGPHHRVRGGSGQDPLRSVRNRCSGGPENSAAPRP